MFEGRPFDVCIGLVSVQDFNLLIQCYFVLLLFFFFFFGLQDSCLFLSSKKAFRTPDEPEIRRNNGLVCMQ